MHSPQRRSSLLAAAQGAAQRGVAFANAIGRNLTNAAGDLPREDAVRLDAMLRRAERIARELNEMAGDIGSLAGGLTAGRDAA